MTTIPSSFFEFLRLLDSKFHSKVALSIHRKGVWETVSYFQMKEESLSLSTDLSFAGLMQGDRVALIGESSPEWMISFFAILLAGGVVVPVDPKLSAAEIQKILSHVDPAMILVPPAFREVARSFRELSSRPLKILALKRPDPQLSRAQERPRMGESESAVISYTSGTLGNPKGVMLSRQALLFEVATLSQLDQRALSSKTEVAYSILPFNHIYGLIASALLSLSCGMELCIAHDLAPPEIRRCLVERRVTRIYAVPLFARMLMTGIRREISEKLGILGGKIFEFSIKLLSGDYAFTMKRLLFKSIHRSFGEHLNQLVCGGSPLDRDTYGFFNALGIPVYDGYGMTETAPVITTNRPFSRRRGSVGKAIDGVEIRIDKNNESDLIGEILTRGPHLMSGYYKSEAETAEIMTPDGWLKTGDLGAVDSDGFLFLHGRKKSMIALSGGKKVLPEEIEAILNPSPAFKEVCALGLKSENGLDEMIAVVVVPSDRSLLANPEETELLRVMKTEVFSRCEALASFKRPHRVIVRRTPLPVTTSLKVKRGVLATEIGNELLAGTL